MNPNRSKPDINTEWIWFYGILGYGYYPNPNLNGYPIEPETFKIPKKLVPNMIVVPNMYPKYTKILLNI